MSEIPIKQIMPEPVTSAKMKWGWCILTWTQFSQHSGRQMLHIICLGFQVKRCTQTRTLINKKTVVRKHNCPCRFVLVLYRDARVTLFPIGQDISGRCATMLLFLHSLITGDPAFLSTSLQLTGSSFVGIEERLASAPDRLLHSLECYKSVSKWDHQAEKAASRVQQWTNASTFNSCNLYCLFKSWFDF